jgi:hypothetical protein
MGAPAVTSVKIVILTLSLSKEKDLLFIRCGKDRQVDS